MFVNNMPTDHVDGYVGLGFLRAFDLLINVNEIGFRRNKLKMKTLDNYTSLASNKSCNISTLRCSSN
jgi:hypothetical protein